jgi:hypothetical protein
VLSELIVVTGLGLIFLFLSWLWNRRTSGGSLKKRLLVTGVLFVIGEVYLMVLIADLKWPRAVLFLAIASWGVLLGSAPWYRRPQPKSDSDILSK